VVAAAPAPVVVPPPPPKVAAPPPPPPPPQTITLDATRLFELNSARLIMPVPQLDSFASALQSNPQVSNVMITGHTDQLGSAAYNQGLSQRRAESVKAYLVSKGIAASRLTAQGVASTRLVTVCNEKTRAAMIKCGEPNRRVVIEPITVPKRQ
jgi:OOP family OmpA-OmpF porin